MPYPHGMRKKQSKLGTMGGELDLIRAIRRRAGKAAHGRHLTLGIGDDCALLRPTEGEELAVTTDLSIAGRHFRLDWHPAEAVGHRTLARGLSDLAAMGAKPAAVFLSLGLPRELTVGADRDGGTWPGKKTGKKSGRESWVERFLDGFFGLAGAYQAPLAGGDLAESPVALADIVLVGAVPRGKALRRSGARPGDLLYVTGKLGGASAGLAELARLAEDSVGGGGKPRQIPVELDALLSPHLYPQPRIRQGLELRRRGLARAAIDLSDGLSTDLAHLCEESGVRAVIEADALPIATGASLNQALHGGEDYELLFAARPSARVPSAVAGVPITRIGRFTETAPRRGAVTLMVQGVARPLKPQGWQHFTEP